MMSSSGLIGFLRFLRELEAEGHQDYRNVLGA